MPDTTIHLQQSPDTSITTADYRWESLHIRTISRGSQLIHLTFSEISHLQALTSLGNTAPPDSKCKHHFAEKQQALRFIKELLQYPWAAECAADFRENPFIRRGTSFQQRIWRLLPKIPPGNTITYGELAIAAGCSGGARAVGQACNANPLALIIPCHRVVGCHDIGGFAGGKAAKEQLLALERELFGEANHPQPQRTDQRLATFSIRPTSTQK